MLRDPNLVPLSRQHQHALALCVRLDRALRAGEVDLAAWQAEIALLFEREIGFHFAAEEEQVFPLALRFPDLQALAQELALEHAHLRSLFSRAAVGSLDEAGLAELREKFVAHIRKEERQLFEGMQGKLGAEELNAMGLAVDRALAEASQACALPSEATRIRGEQD